MKMESWKMCEMESWSLEFCDSVIAVDCSFKQTEGEFWNHRNLRSCSISAPSNIKKEMATLSCIQVKFV